MQDGTSIPAAGRMAIATWFVADTVAEATFFPQIGMRSADAGASAIYWRCVATFYATSLAHNPDHPHLFFTNTDIASVDGVSIADLFRRWGVIVVRLPVTYRLPPGVVSEWGNQFYIFDIIDYLAERGTWPAILVLDADVVVTQPLDGFEAVVLRDGVAVYLHDRDTPAAPIAYNGRSGEELAAFLRAEAGYAGGAVPYCGGEIFAASLPAIRRLAARVGPLWRATLAGVPGAPREEAHLLSLLYALEDMPRGGANAFLKRMWTAPRYRNVAMADRDLALWHLPAEKIWGFDALFRRLRRRGLARKMPIELPVGRAELADLFGIPQRTVRKRMRDFHRRAARKARKMLHRAG